MTNKEADFFALWLPFALVYCTKEDRRVSKYVSFALGGVSMAEYCVD